MSNDLLERPKEDSEEQEGQQPSFFKEDANPSVYDDDPNGAFEFYKPGRNSDEDDDEDGSNENDNDSDPEKQLSAKELRKREANPEAQKTESDDDDEESGFFRDTGRKLGRGLDKYDTKKAQVKKGLLKRKGLWIGAGSGGIMIVALLVVLSFLGDTKILHLAENVTVYNMARSSRMFRQSLSQATAEAIDTEAISESRLSKLRAQFGDSKVKVALDKANTYRPAKVLEGLKSDLTPVFEDGKPSRFLGRDTKVFKGWEYKGAIIEKTDPRFFKPVASYKDKLRFAAEIDAILETDSRGANSLVRGKVLKGFLDSKGIKLRWWEKRGAYYKNLKQEAAEALTQQQAHAANRTPKGACAVADICNAADDAANAVDDVVKRAENESAEEISEKAANTAGRAIKDGVSSKLGTTLSYTSTIYAIALPLCLIFEGSVENSKDTTDGAERSLIQSYMMVRSGADQMKDGATTPEAVSGLSGKLGEVGDSVPQRRASGENVDSATEIASAALPQASSTGTFSLLNVALDGVLPSAILNKVNDSAQSSCEVVTDVRTGIGLAAAELAFTLVTFGSSKAGTEAAKTGFKSFLTRMTTNFAEKLGLQEGFRAAGAVATRKALQRAGGKLLKKIGLETVAILGATELAKMAVVKHMNGLNNGLATDEVLANQVDMGGNLLAQETNRNVMKSKPLAPTELANARIADADYLRQSESEKPLQERYFAINNPNSLLGKVASSVSTGFENPFMKLGQNVSSLLSSMANVPTKLVSAVFNKPAYAAATVSGAGDYNIVQWGYTKEEEALIRDNPDYAPIENQLYLEASGQAEQIEADYSKCYTKTNGELFAEGLIQRAETGEVLPDKGDCSPNNLGLKNSEYGDMVFRWRLAARNQNTLDHLTDMQGALEK